MRISGLLRAALTGAWLAGAAAGAHAQTPAPRWPNGPPASPDYFPIGVWLQNTAYAARYKALGINLYVGLWAGPTKAQLAALKAAGLQAIAPQNAVGLADTSGTIVAWMQDDEPDNAQPDGKGGFSDPTPPAAIVEKYHRMKAVDPTRPVWINFGRGVAWDGWYGRKSRTNRPEDYADYLKGADIASFDIYPGASSQAAIRDQFWRVPYGVARLKEWAKPGTPVWAFIETGGISGPAATPEQVRAQTWAAIVAGATGVTYFVHQFKPSFSDRRLLSDPAMMDSIKATNALIARLAPVLNAPTIAGRTRVVSSDAKAPIAKDGAIYLFAVNIREFATEATFDVEGAPARASIESMDGDRALSLTGGRFSDSFPPFGVRIYKIAAHVARP